MSWTSKNVIVSPEQRQVIYIGLHRALHRRSVRWCLGAFVLTNTLLLVVLLLTEQLRWLPTLWPLTVTRTLFQILFVTSLFATVWLGTVSIGSAVYLYRRRATDARADPMTLLRRAFITPAVYLLSVAWCWSRLTGHSPHIFGAMLVAIWMGSYVVHFVYFTARAFQSPAAAPNQEFGPQTAGSGRLLMQAVQGRITTRIQKERYALRRRWWLLTHRNYIERLSAPDRALFESAVRGVTHNVEILLKRGADPNLRMNYGVPLIAFCASLGRTEAIRALLDADANIDAATPSVRFTALLSAADKGNLALMRLLVERGANIEARSISGLTPLMLAAKSGHAEAVTFLLKSGARTNATSQKGLTPLIFAAIFGHTEVARVLLEAGADPSVRTAVGRTALDYAKRKGYKALSDMLAQVQKKI